MTLGLSLLHKQTLEISLPRESSLSNIIVIKYLPMMDSGKCPGWGRNARGLIGHNVHPHCAPLLTVFSLSRFHIATCPGCCLDLSCELPLNFRSSLATHRDTPINTAEYQISRVTISQPKQLELQYKHVSVSTLTLEISNPLFQNSSKENTYIVQSPKNERLTFC